MFITTVWNFMKKDARTTRFLKSYKTYYPVQTPENMVTINILETLPIFKYGIMFNTDNNKIYCI